ncbi:MAG: outer membrane protein assembly factor BamB [Gammaproteobacteria bacterium]|nr:outer membrane protein assembly factor BamB [Gammaproteobacteria bacterium]
MRSSLILLLIAFITACGSDPIRVPHKLVDIKPEAKVRLQWVRQHGTGNGVQYVKLQPAVNGSIIYSVDRQGLVTAYDKATGKTVWSKKYPIEASAGPTVDADSILIASFNGEVLALNLEDGTQKWKVLVSSEILSAPVSASGKVLVHTNDGKLFAFNNSNGQLQWTYDRTVPVLSLRGTSKPVIIGDIVFDTFSNGKLTILRLNDGKVLLEQPQAIPKGRTDLERMVDSDSGPVVDNDIVYSASYQGFVHATNLRAGRKLWQREISTFLPMLVQGELLYIVDEFDTVWAINKRSGVPVWKQEQLYARALTAPTMMGEYLLFGDYAGYVHVLDKNDGHFVTRVLVTSPEEDSHYDLTEEDVAGIQVAPVVNGNTFYVYANSGRIAAYTIQSK